MGQETKYSQEEILELRQTQFAEALRKADAAKANELYEHIHPVDLAEAMEDWEEELLSRFCGLLEDEKLAELLEEADEKLQVELIHKLDNSRLLKIFGFMQKDDIVDILGNLRINRRKQLIDLMRAGERKIITELLGYDEDTAGGLMGTEMIVVNENWSMPECIKQMRMQAEDLDEIYYVYVVDNDSKLRGVLPLKKMITDPSVSKIKHVMEVDPVSVKADTPIDDVALDFEKYDLVAMPVVDSIGRLLGRITVDDVMDQVRESSERDYQLASGLSSDVETDDTLFTQTKARLPWLLIGMAGGIGNSIILRNFEAGFAMDPALALFIPLIGGTGGNVGTQSSAIVVQGLANGSMDMRNSAKQLFKELGVGLINGCIISLLVLAYNYFFGGVSLLCCRYRCR